MIHLQIKVSFGASTARVSGPCYSQVPYYANNPAIQSEFKSENGNETAQNLNILGHI